MNWLLVGVLIWVALGVPLAVLLGRSIRLADRRHQAAMRNRSAADVVPADESAGDELPAEAAEQPWTGPSTVPFAPSRLPWGGDRSSMSRPRPPVVRHPIRPPERAPRARDKGQA